MLATLLQGKTVGVPARSYVYAEIRCLNANFNPGPLFLTPWKTGGTSLHFRYDADANMNYRTSSNPAQPDYVPQSFSVEFESPGVFTVPFDGTLTLIGGNLGDSGQIGLGPADFKVWVYYDDRPCSGRPEDVIDTSNYAPMYHWLKHHPTDAGFIVPENHTFLLAMNTADTFLVNGATVTPGVNAPGIIVSPGDHVDTTAVPQKTIMTGWLG